MSEMTAMRMGWTWGRIARVATIAAGVGLWLLAAALLWRTIVPSGLHLSGLDQHRYFTARQLSKAARYERFVRWDWVLSQLANLAALGIVAWRAPRIARGMGIGRIGKGLIVGVVALVAAWFAKLPFALLEWWWDRRHGLAKGSVLGWFTPQLPALGTGVVLAAFAILVVMALAGRFPRGWWIGAVPAFTALALLFTFVSGYLSALGTHPVHRTLRAEAASLARRADAPGVPVRVDDVSSYTTEANAESAGVGPSRIVVLDNTILRAPFTAAQDLVVLAHEFTHQARDHLWKGVAWFGLLALPATLLVALATRYGGGIREPGMIPLALLVVALFQLVFLPLTNAVSRRYEAEADWGALRATHDPAAARGLFRSFSTTSLQQPDPPFWDYVLLENHPTIAQRIVMVNAWAARNR